MAPTTAPNLFQLSNESLAVTYSTTSIDGKPRFTFKKGRQSLDFAGNEIASVETSIGTFVSVVIANVPDKSITTFTILLPVIRLKDSKKQAFRTIGITTVAKTTLTGPPPGVEQTYKTVALRGSAQRVAF
jgi:hypothetical protein